MDTKMPSAITPEVWRRLLTAFDAGVRPESPELACHYAGISVQTWQAECERIPEFAIEACRVAASGVISVLLMLQRVAASEWRAGPEYLKLVRPDLFGSAAARGRDAARLGEPGDNELDADVSPARKPKVHEF